MTPRRLSNAVADALAAEIIAMRTEGLFADYAPVATAVVESKKVPVYQMSDLSTLRINASPFSRSSNPASRASIEQEIGVLLMITMRTHQNSALFAQLIDFCNDLDDLLSARYLDVAGITCTWTGSEASPVYDMDVANENKVFRSLMQINYQAFVN